MQTAVTIARVLLGLTFLLFGLNGFFSFIPLPEFHPFIKMMIASGMFYFVKAAEVAAGVLLLTNRFMLAALLILGPLIVNIFLVHLLMDHRNWFVAVLNLIWYLILCVNYWSHLKVFLKAKVE